MELAWNTLLWYFSNIEVMVVMRQERRRISISAKSPGEKNWQTQLFVIDACNHPKTQWADDDGVSWSYKCFKGPNVLKDVGMASPVFFQFFWGGGDILVTWVLAPIVKAS